MRSFRWCGLLLAALGGVFATGFAPSADLAQQDQAIVRVVPASDHVSASSEQIVVAINVENVHDLGAFQFVLAVDSALLRPMASEKTPFLGSTGREVVCPEPTIEEAAIRFACVTLRETPAGVDGSGTIATISLKPLRTGTSKLSLTLVVLGHPDGSPIASSAVDARLTLTGGTFWTTRMILLAAGAAALAMTAVAAFWRARHVVGHREPA